MDSENLPISRSFWTVLAVIVLIFSMLVTGCSGGQVSEKPAAVNDPMQSEFNIYNLLDKGQIEVEVTGSTIDSVNIKVRRTGEDDLTVLIPPGTFLISSSASAQNMITRRMVQVRLAGDSWEQTSIPAACANKNLDIPSSAVTFSVRRTPPSFGLQVLIQNLAEAAVDYAVEQAAIWIMTDNANFAELGTLVGGSFNSRMINEKEAASAMKIMAEIGLDLTGKAIWNDRETILAGLPGGSVRDWLASQVDGNDQEPMMSMPDISKGYVMVFRGYFGDVAYNPTQPIVAASACRQNDPVFYKCSLGAVMLWDTRSGSFLGSLEQLNDRAPAIVWSPDGTRLATTACTSWDETSGCGRAKVIVVEGESLDEVYAVEFDEVGGGLAYSADGRYLAVPMCSGNGGTECGVAILNAADGSEYQVQELDISGVQSVHLDFSPEGSRLLIGSSDGLMLVEAGDRGAATTGISIIDDAPLEIIHVHWSPDGSLVGIISGFMPHQEYVLKLDPADPGGLSLAARFGDVPAEAYLGDMAWSPDGRTLALSTCVYKEGTGCDPIYIALYGTSGSLPAELTTSQKLNWLDAWAMDYAPDGKTLAIVDASGEALRLIDVSWEP